MPESEQEEWWKNLDAAKPEDTREELRIAKVALTWNEWSKIESIALEKGLTFSQAVRYLIDVGWTVEIAFKQDEYRRQKYWTYRFACWLEGTKNVVMLHRKPTKADK